MQAGTYLLHVQLPRRWRAVLYDGRKQDVVSLKGSGHGQTKGFSALLPKTNKQTKKPRDKM
jgi:hypothetical protein